MNYDITNAACPLQKWRNHNGNITERAKIARLCELYVNGMQIVQIEQIMKVSRVTIANLLTRYWFYQRIENPVVIRLESKV